MKIIELPKHRKTGIPAKEALKRTYEVRKLGVGGAIYVPKSLIKKKVKLRLVSEGENLD